MKSKYEWADMLRDGKAGEGKELSYSDFIHDVQQDALSEEKRQLKDDLDFAQQHVIALEKANDRLVDIIGRMAVELAAKSAGRP